MKTKMMILVAVVMLSACAHTPDRVVTPTPPPPTNTHSSSYRKVIEILVTSNCIRRSVDNSVNYITIVEATETGERFEMNGCYGKKGERIKIGY